MALDNSRPCGNAENFRAGGTGNCFQTPSTQLHRIGVTDTRGQGATPSASSALDYMVGPFSEMKAEIEEVLEIGKSPQQPEPASNTSPVEPETLLSVLFPHLDFAVETTDISLNPGETQLFIKFRPKFDQQKENCETIFLRLTVFNSFEHPISALTSYLLGYQATPLKSVVKRCEVPLGAFSFYDRQSVVWVRGNQFIRIDTYDYTPFVRSIATRLDNYLASYIGRDDCGSPRAFFYQNKITVPRGQTFSMQLIEIDALLKEMNSSSEDPEVVSGSGPPLTEGMFEFYATGAGKTRIQAWIADAVTLRPGVASAEIVVEPADVVDTWVDRLTHQNEAELQ